MIIGEEEDTGDQLTGELALMAQATCMDKWQRGMMTQWRITLKWLYDMINEEKEERCGATYIDQYTWELAAMAQLTVWKAWH